MNDERMPSATFVLVHGAFHGGWCWAPVRDALLARGHRVHAPSHTGLGDRAHLLSRDITMDTFVSDIENLVLSEELSEVILVGHSFGTRTAVGVADRIPDRLRHLVFLDGAFPFDGMSRLDAMPEALRTERIARAEAHDGGVSVPCPPATAFGLSDPAQIEWVDRHLTPHPLSVDASRQVLANELGNGVPSTYVRFLEPSFPAVQSSADYARGRTDWTYLEMLGGHDAIISNSAAVTDVLLEIADVD